MPEIPWEFPGATVASPECLTGDPVIIGYVSMFYLGGACSIEIQDHGDYPRWVVDCSDPGEIDEYCVYMNGSIGGAEVAPGDCESTPVQAATRYLTSVCSRRAWVSRRLQARLRRWHPPRHP